MITTSCSSRHDDPNDEVSVVMEGKVAILTVGISASGKTTWANEMIRQSLHERIGVVVICRDDIRSFIQNGRRIVDLDWDAWNKALNENEKSCSRMQTERIAEAMEGGKPIIIADTNISVKTVNGLVAMLTKGGYRIFFKHFDVSYEEAVRRDTKRANGVGPSVIAKQLDQLNKLYNPGVAGNGTGNYIICDIDGTLAHTTSRNVYDNGNDAVLTDVYDPVVVAIVEAIQDKGYRVYIVSGRKSSCRDATITWLSEHAQIEWHELYMRDEHDHRSDVDVKRDILRFKILPKEGNLAPFFVIDDRPRLCRFWRSRGFKVLQVGNPHIEF